MLFNSWLFAGFFFVVFLAYFLLPQKARWVMLLAASYYFYMCWDAKLVILLLLTTVVQYAAARLMTEGHGFFATPRGKKLVLVVGVSVSLAVLFFYKYFDFFSDSLYHLLSYLQLPTHPVLLKLVLPMGISFYTFQTLSYTVDVYRGDMPAEKHFGYFALYISFFPQLVAGPIERADRLLPQLKAEHTFDATRARSGLRRMAIGYFKKIVIADTLAKGVDAVYNHLPGQGGLVLVIATVMFAFQIYCDFSGYSDIAIGCARILGIDLMDNFRAPYLAHSIREFWSRWHISLSTWFRDYVYIPLGGNRSGVWKQRRNLLLTFLLSGLWHGANWTFVLWGLLHGGLQVVENLLRGRFPKLGKHTELHGALEVLCTFTLVCIGWIFFRANNVQDAFYVFGHITDGIRQPLSYLLAPLGMLVAQKRVLPIILFEIALLLGIDTVQEKRGIDIALDALPKPICLLVEFSFVCLIALLAVKNTAAAFIYFQF